MDPDFSIRLSAFEHLRHLVAAHGRVLPWHLLAEPFRHGGADIRLANMPKGIFRPSAMTGGALSIKTTVPRKGKQARYDDQIASGSGHFVYRLQDGGPSARDNVLLRKSYELGAPMVYLYGIAPRLYRPLWPVFVVAWNESAGSCHVAVDDDESVVVGDSPVAGDVDPPVYHDAEAPIRRRYATITAKKRLHQDAFRVLVLRAYASRCAICGLPRDELLDAAHILPDRDERGRPEVPNGLALCQLHHRAYDRNIVGIRPDYVVEVAPRVMGDRDGPVLEHAIKGVSGRTIRLPRQSEDHPRQAFLEERFEEFLASE